MTDAQFQKILEVVTVLTPIITAIIIFIPRLWEKPKVKSDIEKVSADERETMAKAGGVLIDASLDMVKRMKEDAENGIKERYELERRIARLEKHNEELEKRIEVCQRRLDEKIDELRKVYGQLQDCLGSNSG